MTWCRSAAAAARYEALPHFSTAFTVFVPAATGSRTMMQLAGGAAAWARAAPGLPKGPRHEMVARIEVRVLRMSHFLFGQSWRPSEFRGDSSTQGVTRHRDETSARTIRTASSSLAEGTGEGLAMRWRPSSGHGRAGPR